MPARLVVTPGDPAGIGPEIVWKSLRKHHAKWKRNAILCVGARQPFDRLKARVIEADPENLVPPKEKRPYVWLLEAPTRTDPAKLLEGYQTGWSIETATGLVRAGEFDALVTGPIHKERLNAGGYRYTGHTDFLADLCRDGGAPAPRVTMMLANDTLRITLVTVHVSVNEVPARLSRSGVIATTNHTIESLRDFWGIRKPKIAICALNPHAGEGGMFGREEIDILAPAIRDLREKWGKNAEISDPLPADTLFANHLAAKPRDRSHAVVCMYHDQGLIPVKLIDFPHTVNVTLGLPIIRTSVDHGTGFDIAWKNRADPRSFESAVELALRMTASRKKIGSKKGTVA